jgi:predicted transcriptional regulator
MANAFMNNSSGNPFARDVMKTKLITLSADMDVFEAVEILLKNRISGAPVVDKDRRLLGVFSEKSMMKVLVVANYEQIPTNQINSFMDSDPCTIQENTQLLTMAQMFLTAHCRRLPVLRDGILVGQVSRRDIIEAALNLVDRHPNHEKQLLYLSALREMSDTPNAVN